MLRVDYDHLQGAFQQNTRTSAMRPQKTTLAHPTATARYMAEFAVIAILHIILVDARR